MLILGLSSTVSCIWGGGAINYVQQAFTEGYAMAEVLLSTSDLLMRNHDFAFSKYVVSTDIELINKNTMKYIVCTNQT